MACNGWVPEFNGTSTCPEAIRANVGLLVWGALMLGGIILLFTWPLLLVWLDERDRSRKGGA